MDWNGTKIQKMESELFFSFKDIGSRSPVWNILLPMGALILF